MSRVSRFTPEEKVQAVLDFKSGKRTMKEICQELGVHSSGKAVYQWVSQYEVYGEEVFKPKKHNRQYEQETKEAAIRDYVAKRGSYSEIARKYNISSPSIVANWVWNYVTKDDVKRVKKSNTNSEKMETMKRIRKENQQLKKEIQLIEKENEIWKQIGKGKVEDKKQKPKYIVIQELHERHQWSINWMCEVLEVTRAGYYKWLERSEKNTRVA